MRKFFLTISVLACAVFSHDLPICEEFANEKNITCVVGDNDAVITSLHSDGSRTYEFWHNGHKIYMEYSEKSILAVSPKRKMEVAEIPAENVDQYVSEVLDALLDDLDGVVQP